ncbi:MAG TPA: hypothetical protein VN711_02190 [Candidatus Saccharimonadales bacterium]|nr:hypothetical protein [Candidatus Saccharimonadales bacterium]
MKWFFWILLLFISLCLEATVVKVPLVFLLIFLTALFVRKEWIFLAAIASGVLLDSVTFRFLGESSLFFMCFLGILFAYEKKFETQSLGFVMTALGIGTFFYALFFGGILIAEILIVEILGSVAFLLLQRVMSRSESHFA